MKERKRYWTDEEFEREARAAAAIVKMKRAPKLPDRIASIANEVDTADRLTRLLQATVGPLKEDLFGELNAHQEHMIGGLAGLHYMLTTIAANLRALQELTSDGAA